MAYQHSFFPVDNIQQLLYPLAIEPHIFFAVSSGVAMPGKINGNYIIFFTQIAVLMRPDAVIAAGAVDKNKILFARFKNAFIYPAGDLARFNVKIFQHVSFIL
jgi:hypothetical protein